MNTLLPYQQTGARFLASRRNALLADAPRVGKTAQAIAACDLLLAEKVLWLTTASARSDHAQAWRDFQQLKRTIEPIFASAGARLKGDVIVTTYDLACGALLPRLSAMNFDVLVLDEAHRLCNRDTRRTKAIYGDRCEGGGLAARALSVFALTGTPAPNNYAELWPTLRRLAPELIEFDGKPMSFTRFRDKFCKMANNGFGFQIVGNKNADELKRRIASFFLRRTLDDVAPDLPKQRFGLLPIEAGKNLEALVELQKDDLLAKFGRALERAGTDAERDAILGQVDQGVKLRLQRLTGLAKVPGVSRWVWDNLEDDPDFKIALFAWHHDVIEALYADFEGACVVSGNTSPHSRVEQMRAFQQRKDKPIFIGQIQAAGEAIDLSAADEVLFVESSYVPKDNDQAAARVLNIKKTRPTLARFATLAGSIDDRIQAIAKRKAEDIRKVFS
jgi:SNF2 family DNA or RNA helicase